MKMLFKLLITSHIPFIISWSYICSRSNATNILA